MKRVIKIVLICGMLVGVERFCHWQTDGFALSKIRSDLPYQAEWATPVSLERTEEIFNQKFSYFASGGSCYAFVSADGNYVLKFFKHHHLPPKKRDRVFKSCKAAMEHFSQETALLYVHLNRTQEIKKTATLIDKLGIEHKIDLDHFAFLLQKKAQMPYAYINDLMARQEKEKAQQACRELVERMLSFSKKGYKDLDPRIETNFGFVEGVPVRIDVGSLVKDPVAHKKRVGKARHTFNAWLQENHPELREKDDRSQQW